jgi:Arc/MetJ-type ribon-helix-helix transcriptional regulator
MTIRLPKDLEQFVDEAVRAGRYARKDDVIRDAVARLKDAMPEGAATPEPPTTRGEPARPNPPRSKEAFHRRLIEMGLMSQLPDTAADFEDPDDRPIDIPGEPLSETVIRERR